MPLPPRDEPNGPLRPDPPLQRGDVATLADITRQLLSFPREAGTAEAALAREIVAAHLSGLGYTVTLQKFTFAPASLRGFPILGAGLGGLAIALYPFLSSARLPLWGAIAVWAGGLLALGVVATGVALGWVLLGDAPREDANLIATRGAGMPQRWIVAHLDSKAQAHSMAGRLVAVWVVGLAIGVLSVLALLRLKAPLSPAIAGLGMFLAVVAGALASRGRLRGQSRGARDNGSGVVAALKAAEMTEDSRVGILITGAEEFGLVGARVFARASGPMPGAQFVNLDTLDQEGTLYLVSHDSRGTRLARTMAPHLATLGIPLRLRRLPLGIFVDSAPLTRTGGSALTVGRLTWNTLRRIHTPADTPEGLSLEWAERVGQAIAQIDL
jgi:hypothetical protein